MKKLEIFKKGMAAMLSLVMLAVPVLQVRADDSNHTPAPNTGSITIKNPKEGYEYAVYRLFNATISGDNIAYTATEVQKNFFKGVPNTTYKGEIYQNPFEFTKNTAENTDYVYNVSLKEGFQTEADQIKVINYLNGFYQETTVGTGTEEKKQLNFIDGFSNAYSPEKDPITCSKNQIEIVFDNLPYGYYLVTSSLGAVVTLDSVNPNADIIDKNEHSPHWEEDESNRGKFIIVNGDRKDENSVNYGDTVTFELSLKTSNTIETNKIKSYEFKDILGPGFTLDEDSIKVYVSPIDEKDLSKKTKVRDFTKIIKTYDETKGTEFTVSVPWANIHDGSYNFLYPNPYLITVRYNATLNRNAVIGEESVTGPDNQTHTGNLNAADFGYTYFDKETPEWEQDWVYTSTYTYSLEINKTNTANEGLADAQFNLLDPDGKVLKFNFTAPNIYEYNPNGTVTVLTTVKDADDSKKPNEGINGTLIIKGLKDLGDGKNYQLKEIKAPDGYVTLDKAVDIVLNKETANSKKSVTTLLTVDGKTEMIKQVLYDNSEENAANTELWMKDGQIFKKIITDKKNTVITKYPTGLSEGEAQKIIDGYQEKINSPSDGTKVVTKTVESSVYTLFANIINYTQSELPSTGGIGTRVFYIGGGIAAAAGAALILMKKHREDEEE